MALAIALTGAIAVLSGGLLFLTAGSAGSALTSDTPCVPSEAWTETTGWLLRPPGDGWRQVDERTVTDEAAWSEEVVVGWQHYSWTGGPLEAGVVPAVPTGPDDRDWQANTTQEPHAHNPHVTWLDTTGWGLHFTSHGGSGLADWFYLERLTDVVEHPAVTHQEFRYAYDHPAVVCPTQPPTTQPPTTQPPTVLPTPVATQPSDEPEQDEVTPAEEPTQDTTTPAGDVEVLGAQAPQPPSAQPPSAQPPSAQLPTEVAAGLTGASSAGAGAAPASGWGLLLVAGGSVLLATAGGVLVRVRKA